MRKKVFILFLMLTTMLTSYAQSTTQTAVSSVYQIPDSAKLTMMKVYNDAKAGLSGLAGALKTTAEHVYGVLIKQQIVDSVTYLLVLLLLFSISYGLLIFGYKHDFDDDDHRVPFIAFGIIVGIIFVVSFVCSIGTIVTGFINPEYGAINEIINFIK